jgi:DNA-binding transcriptional ArsR family regulator/protein-L-isoaspartate O-methyltransferase
LRLCVIKNKSLFLVTATRAERWELYRLLSEPLRLRLLALAATDELAISELAELLEESQPNVSRHAATLRQAGLLSDRRQGTWTLLKLEPDAASDAVVRDALATGRALCERDGSLGRVAAVVRARDRGTREFFARTRASSGATTMSAEWGAYVFALASLLPRRALAVDAGTGDGAALDALAPAFERVVAIDRSEAQLGACRERIAQRGHENVTLLCAELDGALAAKVGAAADLVLAARVLHHAPKPVESLRALASLLGAGGALVLLDYDRHEDEALRTQQADLWLGFDEDELRGLFERAGLEWRGVREVPRAYRGAGPDRALRWLVATGVRPAQRRERAGES